MSAFRALRFSSTVARCHRTSVPAVQTTRFSTSTLFRQDDKVATDQYEKDSVKQHTLDRRTEDTNDIQSDQSHKATQSRTAGEGGHATTEADERNSTAKAKKDHPEAPDVVIGMQDERGGKGH